MKYVILVCNGLIFSIVGPFDTRDDAEDWRERYSGINSLVAPILPGDEMSANSGT